MNEKLEIILLGAGGHCRSCIDVIEAEDKFVIAGVVERAGAELSQSVLNYPIVGTDEDLPELRRQYQYALVTVGQTGRATTRRSLFDRLRELDFTLPTILSPHAYVSPHAQIGAGGIVMHHALINAGAKIGDNCIINSKALIEHDAEVDSDCHISTGAIVNGGVRVGAGTFLGSNSVTVHEIIIPEGSFVKAGHLERGLR